jgi:hypothetical protein
MLAAPSDVLEIQTVAHLFHGLWQFEVKESRRLKMMEGTQASWPTGIRTCHGLNTLPDQQAVTFFWFDLGTDGMVDRIGDPFRPE